MIRRNRTNLKMLINVISNIFTQKVNRSINFKIPYIVTLRSYFTKVGIWVHNDNIINVFHKNNVFNTLNKPTRNYIHDSTMLKPYKPTNGELRSE